MRIFYAFIVIFAATFLFMLPLTGMVYDFRTDVRTDTFTVTTAAGITSANTTLLQAIYGNDTGTISYVSSISEVPVVASYNATTRQLTTSGLTPATSRTLAVSYDVLALNGLTSFNTLLDKIPAIWMVCMIAFAPAALAAMFVGRRN